jgi:ParB-like nuclease domain
MTKNPMEIVEEVRIEVNYNVVWAKLADIEDSDIQPPNRMAQTDDLKASIRESGLQEPLHVLQKRNGKFVVHSGHRRKKALLELGWTEAPIRVIGTYSDQRVAKLWDATTEVVKHSSFQKMYAHLESGRATKISSGLARNIKLAEDCFGGEEGIRTWLYSREIGPGACQQALDISTELGKKFAGRIAGFEDYAKLKNPLAETARWLVEFKQSLQIRHRIESGDSKSITSNYKVILACILKGVPLPAPRKPHLRLVKGTKKG